MAERFRVLASALLAAVLAGCLFETSRTAGGGSDIGNGGAIAGVILTAEGAPAAGLSVRLRRADYLPPLPATKRAASSLDSLGDARTAANGGFAFAGLDSGEYRLEILDTAAGRGALIDCKLASGVRRVELPETRLRATGELRLRLAGGASDTGTVQVRFYGLERVITLRAGVDSSIRNLPAGTYALLTASPNPVLSGLEARGIAVRPDSATVVDGLAAPCETRACDSAVVADFLARNGLPQTLDSVANVSGRINGLVLAWSDTSLRLRSVGELRRLKAVKTVRMEGPILPDSLADAFFTSLAGMDSLWFLRIAGSGDRAFTRVPASLGRLARLTQLYLPDDSLASIPEEIGMLRNLEMLFLRGNRLESLPAALGNLASLRELHVPFNRLRTIPPAVLRLPKLVKVDVHGNRLCGLGDEEKRALEAKGAYVGPEAQTCP